MNQQSPIIISNSYFYQFIIPFPNLGNQQWNNSKNFQWVITLCFLAILWVSTKMMVIDFIMFQIWALFHMETCFALLKKLVMGFERFHSILFRDFIYFYLCSQIVEKFRERTKHQEYFLLMNYPFNFRYSVTYSKFVGFLSLECP